jgi:DNA-binding transcriptional LysR family regulator
MGRFLECVQWMRVMTTMNELHLPSLDLNLLVALDALLSERNVTRAAARVGVTQSAMSHALGRLRTLVDDPVLVRTGSGMAATPRAEALAGPLRKALEDVRSLLRPPAPFDPDTAQLRARIATSDYGELVLVPPVVRRIEASAPGIDLRLVPYGDDAVETLSQGLADLVIAPVRPNDAAPGILTRKLFDEDFVCVVRRGHPLATRRLTLARFAAASHALISPRGTEGSFVDDALARVGMSRRVAVTVPHFLVAPHVVAASDLILTLASRVAQLLAKPLGLVVLRPPRELALEGFRISALWHERTHYDPARVWVRELFADVARTV